MRKLHHALLVLCAVAVYGQHSVAPHVLGTAGGIFTSVSYTIAGTADQQAIGISHGSSTVQAGFWYTLSEITVAIETPVILDGKQEYSLGQNIPNPFNPSTCIPFSVQEPCRVQLNVYDVQGREVGRIIDKIYTPGRYRAVFSGRGLPSGTYCYRIRMGLFVDAKKMIIVK
ncbi:MAG: hypothetical protein A2268_02010 [Candidatus Raymondbacteria bacterium RifOxyA12_full_50_37]|nr:MAG: hypothetical protein A2496_06765 [Burkholderiales bacterium RIFOXYC12_FULL_60_6]OGJ90720.1 MAG: hypothetical protein A2350_20110 [Candidatus Raymondbacteria bacterium RifOxyB12_full_50_8]OGJ91088.1 MAG: hypothetical protein A2268_02010 [Candidatus Raymondbacteria bacterium RifOxyA12_full_50_37]OGJ92118.1 MAG: hypothetical protein A2248_10840 [Candidatus Raymondbacteria bacterium RIFOXYA2_FULL_49_16]OGJ98474.1 MAG: hypothetical protein A2453_07080 [Candidatus Raymondbacteria bacterium RI